MDYTNTACILSLVSPFLISYMIGFEEWSKIIPILVISVLSFISCLNLIPRLKHLTLNAGICGNDLNKLKSKRIPEAIGLIPASLYLIVLVISQTIFISSKDEQLQYNAAAFSVCFMVLLGFCDDVVDLKWRYKLVMPLFASLPIIMAYSGTTFIIIPKILRPMIGFSIDLGIFYKLYMCMLTLFCTNSINIYAGINGIESGQSIVIACSAFTHNIIEIYRHDTDQIAQQHLLSASLLLPFIFNVLALFKFNRYPSKVFVGDTFCYFAGMTFAMAGILGHYSKTMMLLFLPQILNFMLSIPQLFGIVPCPRHRLPKYNSRTDQLECVPTHFTLINFTLWLIGPTHEEKLTGILLFFQIFCTLVAFFIRYELSLYFY